MILVRNKDGTARPLSPFARAVEITDEAGRIGAVVMPNGNSVLVFGPEDETFVEAYQKDHPGVEFIDRNKVLTRTP